jgi:hypothetical protein
MFKIIGTLNFPDYAMALQISQIICRRFGLTLFPGFHGRNQNAVPSVRGLSVFVNDVSVRPVFSGRDLRKRKQSARSSNGKQSRGAYGPFHGADCFGKIDIWQDRQLITSVEAARREVIMSDYYTMKKLLIPFFSLLIAAFLSSCASEPAATTTTTTTRQTTVTEPTATQQTTTTRY